MTPDLFIMPTKGTYSSKYFVSILNSVDPVLFMFSPWNASCVHIFNFDDKSKFHLVVKVHLSLNTVNIRMR